MANSSGSARRQRATRCELSEGSDDISQRGDALVDLAAVLDRAGQADEALTALRDAIALYERKGNVVGAECAQVMLQRLGAGASVSDAQLLAHSSDGSRIV